jgi:hypothetical protein
MGDLSSAQREYVDALLDDLLDLPEERRIERLLTLPIDDPAVVQEVKSLLRAASAARDFLTAKPERPAEVPADAITLGSGLCSWSIVRRAAFTRSGKSSHASNIPESQDSTMAV